MDSTMSNLVFRTYDITTEQIASILGLPEGSELVDTMLDDDNLALKFVKKYWIIFNTINPDKTWNPTLGAMAVVYGNAKRPEGNPNNNKYGNTYPYLIPILYVALAFDLIKVHPSLMWQSSCKIEFTKRGTKIFKKAMKELKKTNDT